MNYKKSLIRNGKFALKLLEEENNINPIIAEFCRVTEHRWLSRLGIYNQRFFKGSRAIK